MAQQCDITTLCLTKLTELYNTCTLEMAFVKCEKMGM